VELVYRLAAGRDIAEARRWYESQRIGLGREYRQAVRVVESLIKAHPDSFPRVHGDVRRALVTRFPYAVYYQRWMPTPSKSSRVFIRGVVLIRGAIGDDA
jgi:hypothetical protein